MTVEDVSAIQMWLPACSIQDALDSLLCSAFFGFRVPCNLVGAASLGIRKALLHDRDNLMPLLQAIADAYTP